MKPAFKISISISLSILFGISVLLSCKKKSTEPKVLPAAPTSLTTIATCGPEVLLNWTDNANNETGFKIERSALGGAFTQIAVTGADVFTYTDTTVAASTKYFYHVRAYTSDGNSSFSNTDSATTGSGVSGTPTKVAALSGDWYKGTMNSGTLAPTPLFTVQDAGSNPVPGQTIHFVQVEGDGDIAADSVVVGNSCTATLGYTFNGSLGHAVIKAKAGAGIDSELVNLRANVLIPGVVMQGQYSVFGDDVRDLVALNSTPVSVDEDPNFWLMYVNYESTLGVVFVIDDANHNSQADSAEAMIGVIVNTVYTGKTLSNIGIGSSVAAVRAAFGSADSVFTDPTPPAAVVLQYDSLALTFYGNTTDTTIFEIHLFPATPPVPSGPTRKAAKQSAEEAVVSHRYHLFR